MRTLYLRRVIGMVLLGLVWGSSQAVYADDVVVVLSSNLKPYQETLAGIQEALGQTAQVLTLSDHKVSVPARTQLIIAIGGEAALQNYPRDIPLIYCVAPGILLPANSRTAFTAKIYMTPPASTVMQTMKNLQPGLRHLGVLALSDSRNDFNEELDDAGSKTGVDVLVMRLTKPEDLPDTLRSLQSRINGLWIPPDPHLITRQNFNLIKEFCLSNHIAFYVPTVELVGQGAAASVAVSFEQMGRTAGQVAVDFLKGVSGNGKVYPEKGLVALNLKSAEAMGLSLTSDQIKRADKVLP